MVDYAPPVDRAYSLLEIKSVDAEARIVEGIATTPTPDRIDDILEPLGGVYTLPIPLKYQHGKDVFVRETAVRHGIAAGSTGEGISVRVRFKKADEPGHLRDILDFAWQAVKKRLVCGFSIGFNPLEAPKVITRSLGRRFCR